MDFRRCYGCYGWCKSVARRLRLTFMVPKSYVRSNSGIKFAELTLQLFIKRWNIHPIKSRFVKSWHTFLKSQIFILYHVMTEKEKMWVSKIYFDSNWGFIILNQRTKLFGSGPICRFTLSKSKPAIFAANEHACKAGRHSFFAVGYLQGCSWSQCFENRYLTILLWKN